MGRYRTSLDYLNQALYFVLIGKHFTKKKVGTGNCF